MDPRCVVCLKIGCDMTKHLRPLKKEKPRKLQTAALLSLHVSANFNNDLFEGRFGNA